MVVVAHAVAVALDKANHQGHHAKHTDHNSDPDNGGRKALASAHGVRPLPTLASVEAATICL